MRTPRQQHRLDRTIEILRRHALTRGEIAGRFNVSGQIVDKMLRRIQATVPLVRDTSEGDVRYRVGA